MLKDFQYIDGVGSVSVINGMAHIDLVVARPTAEGQQPQIEPVQRLVMTLPQFVRLCLEMAGHLQRMEQKGLVTRRPADGAAASGAAGNQAASPSAPSIAARAPAPEAEDQKRRGLFRRG